MKEWIEIIKKVVPYLIFDGDAKEAIEFYANVFEAEVFDVQTYGDAGHSTAVEAADRIIHARLRKDALLLYFSDAFPGHEVKSGNDVSIALEFDSAEEQEKVYNRLQEGGVVHMELQETFWGAIYTKVEDRYGYIWDLNFEITK